MTDQPTPNSDVGVFGLALLILVGTAALIVGLVHLSAAWSPWADDPDVKIVETSPSDELAEVQADIERLRLALCIALDEAGRDSTSQLDVEACGP